MKWFVKEDVEMWGTRRWSFWVGRVETKAEIYQAFNGERESPI